MTITPIPYEQGRFYVDSMSRPAVTHVVDLRWQETKQDKMRAFCSCEDSFCHGHVCKHLLAVVQYERERLNL